VKVVTTRGRLKGRPYKVKNGLWRGLLRADLGRSSAAPLHDRGGRRHRGKTQRSGGV